MQQSSKKVVAYPHFRFGIFAINWLDSAEDIPLLGFQANLLFNPFLVRSQHYEKPSL